MGSSPIARSIFFLFFLFSYSQVSAQVTADKTLPFHEGEVVLLPATTAYLGDLPHFIDLVPNEAPYQTLGGNLAPLVGWSDPLGQSIVGLRSQSPGVYFENIPCPFPVNALVDLPASGTAQVLNFPAQGWLGSQAALGAVNLTAPEVQDHASNQTAIWGGTGVDLGAADLFENSFLEGDLDYRHGLSPALGQTDQFSLISRENWFSSGAMSCGSGFLGMNGNGVDWYSAYLDVDLTSPNFQSLQFKPYYQNAQVGGQNAQDVGGFLNYLFNLAGLAESHLGLGWDSLQGNSGLNGNKGFLQSTNLVDVLGDISMDAAFRWDFSSTSNTTFSTVLGLQGKLDSWVLLADYDKSVSAYLNEDVQQADGGLRFQPNDSWNITARYIYEQLGSTGYAGCEASVLTNAFDGWEIVHSFQIQLTERLLTNSVGTAFYDTGFKGELKLTSQDRWWVQGRCLSNEPLFMEAGVEYALSPAIRVFGAFENLTNIPASLPSLDAPVGVTVTIGVQYSAN